jgi:hypothetical protein
LHVGFTFFDGHHLWFVVTEPDRDNEVVMVNATTLTEDFPDTTCKLTPQDHPSLTHKSVIFYGKAKIFNAANFQGSIKGGQFRPRAQASDELMVRIRMGVRASEHTSGEVWQKVGVCPWKPGSGAR